jgi:predicted acyltransferase
VTVRIADADRLASLDAFRGFTIAGMLLVNNPGSWSHIHPPLAHAPWHGWTFTDWIFPFFLFISGLSMKIAVDLKRSKVTDGALLRDLWRRALVIVVIGVLLNGFPHFDWSQWRLPGVLQRIGLCAFIAAPLVVFTSWRAQAVAAFVVCAVYTFAMHFIAVPGPDGVVAAGVWEAGKDFGAHIDRMLLEGHLWAKAKVWDPEGVFSTLPAIASFLAGSITGAWLRNTNHDTASRTVWMLLAGAVCLWLGDLLGRFSVPINKNLWSPAYAVFMTGFALWCFGAFYWLMDACASTHIRERARKLAHPLTVYGLNALFLFVLAGVVGRLLNLIKISGAGGELTLKNWLYAPIQSLPLSPVNTSLLYALCFVGVFWAIAWAMWRKRWFVKV